jgi:hypothetical protein
MIPHGGRCHVTAARLTEALLQLAGWATGVRLAYETLREMDA